jgi:hypothetical protein
MVAALALWGACSGGGEPAAPGSEASLPAYVPTPAMPAPAARALTPQRLRRLTNAEMENVYADLLGGERLPLQRGFLPDPFSEGFDNDALLLGVGTSKSEELMTAAERVAAALVAPASLERQAPCPAGAEARGCARAFISRATAITWGRPPTDDELGRLEEVFTTGVAEAEPSAGYAGGISLVTEAILASPHFVYRTELGKPPADPAATEVTLEGPEIASALSFLFRGARPDAPLMEAALAGSLVDPATRAAHAERLLATAEGRRRIDVFVRSWLGLTDVAMLNKDLGMFPVFTPAVRQAMDRELTTFIEHVMTMAQGRLDELFLADYSFPARVEGLIYGEDTDSLVGNHTMVKLGPNRRGLLSSPAFLATHALISQTNPVERGLMVRGRLLCQEIPPPPPEVLAQTPSGGAELTTRAKYEAHQKNPSCAGCHRMMDPIGFGFEQFDAIGRFRIKEGDNPVDARGELVGTDVDGPFVGPAALSQRLVRSLQFRRCFVQQLVRFAEGRGMGADDAEEIRYLTHQLEMADHRIGDVLVALVKRPTFILRKIVKEAP